MVGAVIAMLTGEGPAVWAPRALVESVGLVWYSACALLVWEAVFLARRSWAARGPVAVAPLAAALLLVAGLEQARRTISGDLLVRTVVGLAAELASLSFCLLPLAVLCAAASRLFLPWLWPEMRDAIEIDLDVPGGSVDEVLRAARDAARRAGDAARGMKSSFAGVGRASLACCNCLTGCAARIPGSARLLEGSTAVDASDFRLSPPAASHVGAWRVVPTASAGSHGSLDGEIDDRDDADDDTILAPTEDHDASADAEDDVIIAYPVAGDLAVHQAAAIIYLVIATIAALTYLAILDRLVVWAVSPRVVGSSTKRGGASPQHATLVLIGVLVGAWIMGDSLVALTGMSGVLGVGPAASSFWAMLPRYLSPLAMLAIAVATVLWWAIVIVWWLGFALFSVLDWVIVWPAQWAWGFLSGLGSG
jgi:hypothetical protein